MPWSVSQLGDELNCPHGVQLLASCEHNILGYVLFRYVCPEAELLRIGVADRWRQHGIGRILWQEGHRRLVALGVETCFLEVRQSNRGARKFYHRLGFGQVGIRKNYYEHPVEDALILQRHMGVLNI